MPHVFYCSSCGEWGRRFNYGCRKCRIGMFKHSKCGCIVTSQYGFCPECYPERLDKLLKPKPKKVKKYKNGDKPTMPCSYEERFKWIPSDKPTLPAQYISPQDKRTIYHDGAK
jgi:hypothetical protein